MADLEQELNNAVENTEVQEPQNVQTETETTTAETIQEPQTLHDILNGKEAKTPEPPQNELWKQTKNFEKGLWKTPDDIYKSVQYYEQKYQPLEQSLRHLGFNEPSQLEQALKEYQEKMPEYQENANLITQLNALLQNETYGSKLRSVFDEIRRAQETEKFGMAFDDLPPIIKERVVKGEQAFQRLEEMERQQAYEKAHSIVQDQMAQIIQKAQEAGIDFGEKEQIEFLNYCTDNNISAPYLLGTFLSLYYPHIIEKAKQTASLATTAQNKQNKAKALNSSTKTQTAQTSIPTMNSIDDLEKALNQIE